MDINIESQIVVKTAAQWAIDATVYSNKRILITSDATYGATDQRKFKIPNGVDTWSNLDYFPVSGFDDATSSIQTQLNGKQSTLVSGTNIKTVNGNNLLGSGDVVISGGGESLADTLAIGNTTNDTRIKSNDSKSYLDLIDGVYVSISANDAGVSNGTMTLDGTNSLISFSDIVSGYGGSVTIDTTSTAISHSSLIILSSPEINLTSSNTFALLTVNDSIIKGSFIDGTNSAYFESNNAHTYLYFEGLTAIGFIDVKEIDITINHDLVVNIRTPLFSYQSGNTFLDINATTGVFQITLDNYNNDNFSMEIGAPHLWSAASNIELTSGNDLTLTATSVISLTTPNIILNSSQVNFNSDAFFISGTGIDTTSTVGSDVLNIGVTNAEVINYGNASTIHNFLGTAIYELQVNSYVTDKLITLNYGGAIASGIGVGFEIEENNVITGFLKTNAARDGFSFSSPANAFVGDLKFSATSTLTVTGTGAVQGTNTGDQTSIVGITGTKAQFNSACSDGNFLYVGDITLAGLGGLTQQQVEGLI